MARANSPPINSAINAFVPWPAPLNFKTYRNPSLASKIAGREPPYLKGVMYLITSTVLMSILLMSK